MGFWVKTLGELLIQAKSFQIYFTPSMEILAILAWAQHGPETPRVDGIFVPWGSSDISHPPGTEGEKEKAQEWELDLGSYLPRGSAALWPRVSYVSLDLDGFASETWNVTPPPRTAYQAKQHTPSICQSGGTQ